MSEQPAGTMQIEADLVRQLAELLDETQLTEIEVQDGDRRIRVARKHNHAAAPAFVAAPAPAPVAAPAPAPAPAAPVVAAGDHPGTVKSPMVGTAYLTPSPEADAFVSVGDTVSVGQTVLIIEAMKVMNQIVAPKAGVVRAILVESGQPVAFDQPLLVVE